MDLFEYTYDLVRQIPSGKVSSYGAVAEALGDKIAARAIGRMMNQNPDADTMPCFKIVHSDGRLGGFGLGIDDKIKRLKEDKIKVEKGKIVDFESVFFDDFKTDYPLRELRKEQLALAKKIVLKEDFSKIETIAGIDIAYPESEFDDACGACVVMDYTTKEIVEQKTVFGKTNFPYISTYLSYRELPIIKRLINSLKEEPTVFMFDGNGVLHPYGIGLASQVGVTLDISSIGVAKSLLYGKIENDIVTIDGKKKGLLFFSSNKIKKPIYVSPGNKISFETSFEIVKNLSSFRIPEPLRQSHILASENIINQ